MLKLTILDYFLVPVYFVLLSVIFRLVNKKYNAGNKLASVFFINGFHLKLLFGVLFGLFSIFVIPGDTEMYYTGGIDYKHIISEGGNNLQFLFGPAKDFEEYYRLNGYRAENFGYLSNGGNLLAAKFVAIFSVFSFNSYMVISMFFSLFSFAGLWFLFKGFGRIYPALQKPIFFIFFLIPSVLFWGSGVLKDTLCLGFLGIGFYNAYLFFFERKYKIRIAIAFIISFYCLFTLKSYIAMAFLPSFAIWFWLKNSQLLKSPVTKAAWLGLPVIAVLLMLYFGTFDNILAESAIDSLAENVVSTQENYIRATPDDGALIDYGTIDPSLGGILRIMPKALVATLFRPFLWEAKKVTSLIAALEGAFLFGFTIFVFVKRGIFKSVRLIFSDSTIFFSFLFSIVFATAIGLNCFNLGTLVRYKIPCLPFYLLSLLLILTSNRVQTVKPAAARVKS